MSKLEDKLPPRNLPGSAEAWGRAMEAQLKEIKKALGISQRTLNTVFRASAGQAATIEDQLSQLVEVKDQALQALDVAGSTNSNYYGPEAPDSEFLKAGDVWFDAANDNRVMEWNGDEWIAVSFGGEAFENGAITAEKISDEVNDTIQDAVNNANDAKVIAESAVVDTYDEYATSSDPEEAPESGWSTDTPPWSPGVFIWRRNVVTYGNGTTVTGLPVLVTGNSGTSGTGVLGSSVTYQTSASGSTPPGGTWSETVPSVAPGEFLWTRTIITYSDSSSTTLYSVGGAGSEGVGIESSSAQYTTSTNGTTPPTSGWQSSIPSVPAGHFLWTRTTVTFSDTSTQESYSVARSGADGADGRGIVSTTVSYAVASSGTSEPSTGWQANVPSVPSGQYLWTRTVITYSSGTPSTTYSVARQGVDGGPGAPGTDGRGVASSTTHYAVSTNGTSHPSTGWQTTIPSVPAGQFLWTRITWAFTEGPNHVTYSVAKAGETGAPGAPGADGRGILSTEIRYQAGSSGTTTPTGTWQTSVPTVSAGQYLWTRTTVNYTSGTPSVSYSVGRMGTNGSNGTPGAPGTNGQTSYLHVAYANNSTGTSGFSTEDPSGRSYMGTYTDYTEADSTDPSKYTWVLIKGATGNTGPAGKGIASTVIHYAQSTSGTSTPSSGWQTTIPPVPEGQYLWTRTRITFTDSAQTDTFTVAKQGEKGATGAPGATGAAGRGVSSVTQFYWMGTSAPSTPTVSPPPSPWTTTEPTYTGGTQNLYGTVRTIYSSGSPNFTYSPVSLLASFQAAKTAYNLANSAMSVAGSKSTVLYSTSTPSGSAETNDVWRRQDGSGNIIGEWRYTGTGWQQTQLTNTVISNLDAGKITSGTINANRIAANSIESSKLLIQGGNLVPNPTFETLTGWEVGGGLNPTLSTVTRGRAAYFSRSVSGNRTLTSPEIYVAGDTTYTIGAMVLRQAGSPAPAIRLEVVPVNSSGVNQTPVVVATLSAGAGTNWTSIYGQYKVPPSSYRGIRFRFVAGATSATTGNDYIVQPRVVQAAVGEMIVDGAITADSAIIANSAIGSAKIADLAVTNAKIANTTIQSAKIANLDAAKITSGSFSGKTFTGGTFTGSIFRTSASGQRVQMDPSGLKGFNSGNQEVFNLMSSDGEFRLGLPGNTNVYAGSDGAGGHFTLANEQRGVTLLADYGIGAAVSVEASGSHITLQATQSSASISANLDLTVYTPSLNVSGSITSGGTAVSLAGHTHTGAQVSAATETARGTVERATQAEVNAGTDTTRYVSPARLRNSANIPYAMAAGTANPSGSGVTTVTLPAGRFSVTPRVYATIVNNSTLAIPLITDVSGTVSFSARIFLYTGTQATGWIHWQAVQMRSNNAAG